MFSWFGTVFGIIGAVLVAANAGIQNIGYMFFLIGSFFSLIAAIKEKHNANTALWFVFASINVFGLIKSL